jgi:Zn-dependent metalloprotease
MKKIMGLVSLFFAALSASAQLNSKLTAVADEIQYDKDQPVYVRIKTELRVQEDKVAAFISAAVFNSDAGSLSLLRTERDELGYTHYRYGVLYNNVLLSNRTIIAHCANGKLVSFNGEIGHIASPSNSFMLSEQVALQAALKKVNAQKYKWENKEEEAHMRIVFNQPDFSYQPVGRKVIVEKDGKFLYAWMFNIYAEVPLYRANVIVDAGSGQVIEEQNQICTADAPGTAVTKYSGNQTFTCDQNGSIYRLRETQRGNGVETYNLKNTTSYGSAVDFTNTTTSWNSTGIDQGATDAHWGAEQTYDYYLTQHNRNSINNAGFKLVSYVHYSNNYTNAFWDGQRMTYGDGSGSSMKIFTTIDICGHEISHGLTSNSAGLAYNNESGALNESYSDIFGASIENYARPGNWNWKIGEDMTGGGVGLRNMANPGSFGDPDTYGGSGWYTGTADNGGVHTNSGVSNFWYYLLTAGGSGVNDISNSYSVTGLGFTKSSNIAYRALTVYYTSTTNYAVARILSLQAAKDLYGNCSQELISTMNAWHAVGIGAKYIPGLIGPDFICNNTNYCAVPSTVHFTNTSVSGLTYTWDFGDGTSSNSVNPSHTYSAIGNYNVKLTANGCGGGVDSVVRSSYISLAQISPPVVSSATTGCMNGSAVLNASGNNTLVWFEDLYSKTVIGTGSPFATPALSLNTVFYVANSYTSPVAVGGILSNTGGGFYNTTVPYLIFNVNQSSVLNSVVVYAFGPGTRIFQLRSATNIVLASMSASLAAGANTVNLNFNLNPGIDYRLGLSPSSTTGLYRSVSGVSYPYSIGGLVDITTSSQGNNNYFWFYNWNVSKAVCTSARFPVTVTLLPATDIIMGTVPAQVCASDEVLLDASPAGGVFSGSGVTGNTFNASSLGAGTYFVNYTYTDANNCAATATVSMVVDICEGIAGKNYAPGVVAYPNPADDALSITNAAGSNAEIMDASGRVVLKAMIGSDAAKIDISSLAGGMYILSVRGKSQNEVKTLKLVIE